MKKRAIFFDLDGTLWNALIPLMESYNKTMEDNHYPYHFDLKTVQSFMGLTPEETVALIFPDRTLEEGLKIFKQIYLDELKYLSVHPGTLYPNVRETLDKLKEKYSLYIVSNADKGYVENFISSLHMEEYFTSFIQAGDTGLDKHDNIKLLKQRERIDEVIYVGDTYKDKVETKKAGEQFIHAAYGFGRFSPDEVKIDSFDELPNVVEKLLK